MAWSWGSWQSAQWDSSSSATWEQGWRDKDSQWNAADWSQPVQADPAQYVAGAPHHDGKAGSSEEPVHPQDGDEDKAPLMDTDAVTDEQAAETQGTEAGQFIEIKLLAQ